MDNVMKAVSSAIRGLRYKIQSSISESKNYTDKKAKETLSESKNYTDVRIADGLPKVTAIDNGKFLRVVNGEWAADTVRKAEGASF